MLKIEEYSFGRIVISSSTYSSDLKILGSRIIHPWWRKHGHRVEIEDIQDLLEASIKTLVLGKGDPGMMKASPSLKEELKKRGITLIELPTREAIRVFNKLVTIHHQTLAGGFHLTC